MQDIMISLNLQKGSAGASAQTKRLKKPGVEYFTNALSKLNEENREVLILSRFQEMKYHEIATIMNITEGAVESKDPSRNDTIKKHVFKN